MIPRFTVSYAGYTGRVKDVADAIVAQAKTYKGSARVIIKPSHQQLEIELTGDDRFKCAYEAAVRLWFDNLPQV